MTFRGILLEHAQCPWFTINKISFACLHGDMVMVLLNFFILAISVFAWRLKDPTKKVKPRVYLIGMCKVITGMVTR